jgi:hypothetical protein
MARKAGKLGALEHAVWFGLAVAGIVYGLTSKLSFISSATETEAVVVDSWERTIQGPGHNRQRASEPVVEYRVDDEPVRCKLIAGSNKLERGERLTVYYSGEDSRACSRVRGWTTMAIGVLVFLGIVALWNLFFGLAAWTGAD